MNLGNDTSLVNLQFVLKQAYETLKLPPPPPPPAIELRRFCENHCEWPEFNENFCASVHLKSIFDNKLKWKRPVVIFLVTPLVLLWKHKSVILETLFWSHMPNLNCYLINPKLKMLMWYPSSVSINNLKQTMDGSSQ